MSNKTDITANVGKHKFELAGLGKAPFRFTGMTESVITYPDGSTQAGSSCDYCGTGIRYEFGIVSADGIKHKVGCNCVAKVGDEGLMQAYKRSPEYRKAQAAKRQAKATEVYEQFKALLMTYAAKLSALPHPQAWIDRKTGNPMTFLDYAQWYCDNAGNSGREGAYKHTLRVINNQAD